VEALDRAIRAGENAVETDPGSSVAHDLLGRAYGLKAKDSFLFAQAHLARKARACFEKAVALDPANVSARSDLATYDMRAPALLGGGKSKARRQAEEVLKLDAARGRAAGRPRRAREELAEAENQFRLAVEASAPGQLRARRAFSEFLVGAGRYAPARQIWLDLLQVDRSNLAARYELAGIAIASNDGLDRAAEQLTEALAWPSIPSDPSRARVYERLAQVGGSSEARPGPRRARGSAAPRAVPDRLAPLARQLSR
jgi:tetratricopeptide (TPR) repeat protein